MFGGVEKVAKTYVLFVVIFVVSAPCAYSCTSPDRLGPKQECADGHCVNGQCKSGECQCDIGWTGKACLKCCDLKCPIGQICDVDATTGAKLCTNYVLYAVSMSVMVSLIAVLSALLVVVIVISFLLWRKRSILLMKIVHYRQKLEDPDRPFDVFVSYRDCPDDERFVIRELVPKLENQMQLKVCVLARNAAPGAAMSETIISAVKNSSRTILVVSPEYCRGDWASFEYQVAQAEMSQLRHKIVPIIFKDVSDVTMDDLLDFILKSSKALRWPDKEGKRHLDRFWTRLRLQMPRIKRKSGPTDGTLRDDEVSNIEHVLDISNLQVGAQPIDDSKMFDEESGYVITELSTTKH